MHSKNDLISETLGNWGKWQCRTVLLIFLCKIPACWCMAIIIFTAPSPQQVPVFCSTTSTSIIASSSNTTSNLSESDHALNLVMHPVLIEPNDKQFDIDYCNVRADLRAHNSRYNRARYDDHRWPPIDASQLGATETVDEHGNFSIPCAALSYRPFYHLKETRFDVICSRNLVAAFTQFFHLFGVVSGGLIALSLMAFVSPKNLMLCGMVGQLVCGIYLAFVNDFWLQSLARLLCSISCAQMYTAGTAIYITGGKHRTYVTCLFDTFWSIGAIIMPVISYYAGTWQNTYLSISLPTCGYIMVWYFIGDSPRWHLQNGNYAKAANILMEAAAFNGNACPSKDDLYTEIRMPNKVAEVNRDGGWLWLQLWSRRNTLLNIVCIHVAWGVFITNLNGLLLNTRAFGNDSVRWNVAMTGCAELIGTTFGLSFILDAKRKWLWTGLLNVSGGLMVLFLSAFFKEFADNTNSLLVVSTALTIKLITSITLVLLLSSTAELVAPAYRKTLLLSCTVCGRTCLLTASFIGSLTLISAVRPFVVFSLMGTVGGLALCILNPGVRQPAIRLDTIDVEEMDKLTQRRKIEIM